MRNWRWRPLLYSLLATALALGIRRWWGELYAIEVAGESMTPAFRPGDFLLARRTSLRSGLPRDERACGLVVCAQGPDGRVLLKRIVGVPGDSMRIGAEVQVAGRALIEPYAHGETPPAQYRGVHALGPDEYMLLGDHRAASTDSRDFGPVPASRIEGVAWLRYWPPGRLGRIRREPRRLA